MVVVLSRAQVHRDHDELQVFARYGGDAPIESSGLGSGDGRGLWVRAVFVIPVLDMVLDDGGRYS